MSILNTIEAPTTRQGIAYFQSKAPGMPLKLLVGKFPEEGADVFDPDSGEVVQTLEGGFAGEKRAQCSLVYEGMSLLFTGTSIGALEVWTETTESHLITRSMTLAQFALNPICRVDVGPSKRDPTVLYVVTTQGVIATWSLSVIVAAIIRSEATKEPVVPAPGAMWYVPSPISDGQIDGSGQCLFVTKLGLNAYQSTVFLFTPQRATLWDTNLYRDPAAPLQVLEPGDSTATANAASEAEEVVRAAWLEFLRVCPDNAQQKRLLRQLGSLEL